MASPEQQSSALTEAYSYETLPEGEYIRVLELQPGALNDPIECHLEIAPLDAVWRKYHAISYVWGDAGSQRDIIVDGKRLSITLSLWEALQHFRDEEKTHLLWADAICIKQSDPPEKGTQVQLMKKIYEGAGAVRVWLGPDTDGIAGETVDFIASIVADARELARQYGSVFAIPVLPDSENPISKDRRKWDLYEQFLQLPWFDRVWVIQEVGIACEATMHWGNAEIPYSAVINLNEFMLLAQQLFTIHPVSWTQHDVFVGIFNYYENQDSWRNQLIEGISEHWKQASAAPSLAGVLIQGSRRGVTDKRDLIYAFLGHPVAIRNGEPVVQADYGKSVDEVYLDVTKKLLEWELNPALPLSVAAGMGKKQPRDLDSDEEPTWVIRWDLGLQVNWMGAPAHWHYAGGIDEKVPKVDVDKNHRALTMVGVPFDEVSWVSEIVPAEDIALDELVADPDRIPALTYLWEHLKDTTCRYPEGQERRDAMTVTLVASRWPNDVERQVDAPENMQEHREMVDGYLRYITYAREHHLQAGGSKDALPAEMMELLSLARNYEVLFKLVTANRRFFVTRKGFFGIGPPLLKQNDTVVVLEGVKVPFCLRDVQGVTYSGYKLVGPAYVQGVMRGEVLKEDDPLVLGAGHPRDIVIV